MDIPFALIPLKSYEVETRINWRAAALKAFPSISKLRVDILTKAYWKKHAHKQFVSTQLLNDLTLAIRWRVCNYVMILLRCLLKSLSCRCMDSPTS